MSRPAAVALGVLAVAALIGYGVIAHLLTVSDDRTVRGYAFALASMWVLAVAAAWATRWRWPAVVAASLGAWGAWVLQRHVAWDPRYIYLIQHAGTHLWLGVLFGSTLRTGAEPLVTRLATIVHGPLPPRIAAYTRKVTLAWTLYFLAVTSISLVLFFAGWSWWWSVLVNFAAWPGVLAMFVVEYIVRRLSHPDFPHVTFFESFRSSFGRRP